MDEFLNEIDDAFTKLAGDETLPKGHRELLVQNLALFRQLGVQVHTKNSCIEKKLDALTDKFDKFLDSFAEHEEREATWQESVEPHITLVKDTKRYGKMVASALIGLGAIAMWGAEFAHYVTELLKKG